MIDLDHFKSLNDRFGHPFGDSVLQRVGDNLGRALRPMDAACRYGGEELAVILPDTGLAGASCAAGRLRELIREIPFEARGKKVVVTASLGVSELHAIIGGGPGTGGRLIDAADRALYAAKAAGRDCVRTSDALSRIIAA